VKAEPQDAAETADSDLLEKRLELLRGASILSTLTAADLRRLATKLSSRKAQKDALVVTQGDVSDRIFFIESGRCEVRVQWAPGHSVIVGMLSTGEFFGIGAIEPAHVQLASVTALEPCDLLELTRDDIDVVLAKGTRARAEFERLVDQRREAIQMMVGRVQSVGTQQHGMIVAVYAVKGGAGRTSIAVNLAAALGQKHRGECVLLDLGLPYNHAALVANLVPTGCLALSDRPDSKEFEAAVLTAALHHPTGMAVLSSALRVEEAELVTAELVQRALDVLEQAFTYIVVDLGVSMTEGTLGVLERASRILVIVTPELPTLKDTAALLNIFESVLRIPAGHVSLVLNHPRPSTMVKRADAEGVVGRPMEHEIGYDGARFDQATVTGEVLVVAAPASPVAKGIVKMAASIAEEHLSHSGNGHPGGTT
jgi:Flp pilus assembly CpaE family ATPase